MIKFLGFVPVRAPRMKAPKPNLKKGKSFKYKTKTKKAPKRNFGPKKLEDKARKFPDFLERMAGPKSMLKDHTASQFQKNSVIKQRINEVRMDTNPYNSPIVNMILVKVINKIMAETGHAPQPTKITREEGVPQQIYKSQDGVKFKSKVKIEHGPHNRYLKSANNEYGTTKTWLPRFDKGLVDDTQLYLSGRIWSQTGANRQGIMTNGLLNKGSSFIITGFNPIETYNYFGLPSYGMICDYFARFGLSTNTKNKINSTVFQTDYNIDMYTNINSRYSVHEFFNSNRYMDANIKVYVCECKTSQYGRNIWNDVAGFGNSAITADGNRIPEFGLSTESVQLGIGTNKQWFAPDAQTIKLPTGLDSEPKFLEFSTVLGVTPQQSQVFKDNWDVLDVIDCTIAPQDSWTLNIEENFSKGFSVREWLTEFGEVNFEPFAYTNQNKMQSKGDIVLFTVFSGEAAGTFQAGGTPTVAAAPIAVDASPCVIRHTVRHGISTAWPMSAQQKSGQIVDPTEEQQGFVSIKQKSNFTDRETWDYDSGSVVVMSNKDIERGGQRYEL